MCQSQSQAQVPSSSRYAQPELAQVCRVLLASTGLPGECWEDDGPGPDACRWLAGEGWASDDQRAMLAVCSALWSGEGPLAAVFALSTRPALALSSYLAAQAVDGAALWASSHRQ